MMEIRGSAAGTTLTGVLFERGEDPPSFSGAPNDDAPYVWVCDEFYAVDSGGAVQQLEDREINVAFETPMPRGFDTRERAVEAAREHIRTQFARIGIDPGDVTIVVEKDHEREDESGSERRDERESEDAGAESEDKAKNDGE